MECDKHPINFLGLNPQEFGKEFLDTNWVYQKLFFNKLSKEYIKQCVGDFVRNRIQLSAGLENLSTSCYMVSIEINKGEEKDNIVNLSPKDSAYTFGFTDYFYQKECFLLIKEIAPKSFDSVLKSIDVVCKSCKKYMKNPFE